MVLAMSRSAESLEPVQAEDQSPSARGGLTVGGDPGSEREGQGGVAAEVTPSHQSGEAPAPLLRRLYEHIVVYRCPACLGWRWVGWKRPERYWLCCETPSEVMAYLGNSEREKTAARTMVKLRRVP